VLFVAWAALRLLADVAEPHRRSLRSPELHRRPEPEYH